ncbi:unnamed protein product [Miscanthus lutarioriparius]|uniref:Cation/H(+) antiporter central domain-containing protein n=1 Tax=Miscanthus lutarioriparius TaxID=422564 RepID=A0A811NMI0_9POAL|nr:unnamed protein product [Miscanthus lutarioriparius]
MGSRRRGMGGHCMGARTRHETDTIQTAVAGRHTPAHPTHLPSISGDALLAAAALVRVRVLPLYVAHVCLSLRQTTDDVMELPFPWWKVFFVTVMGTLGKLTRCAAAGLLRGLGMLEALALGMLLNMKGYFHLYYAHERAVAAHGAAAPRPVQGVAPRGGATRPAGRTDAVLHHGGAAMTDQTAAAIVKGGRFDGVTVVDEEVSEMRKLIGEALDAYQSECGGCAKVKVRRLLALSSFPDMHSDMCICAEDAMAALVLLPFHKAQRSDGSMEPGHHGFRVVNQKVLQLAPCSVGVVVDRGLGGKHASVVSTSSQSQQSQTAPVVVVFIGGADDREALTLASLMSKHPGAFVLLASCFSYGDCSPWTTMALDEVELA